MNHFQLSRVTAALVAASLLGLSLGGCVTQEQIDASKGAAIEAQQNNQKAMSDFQDRVRRKREAVEREEDVDKPFLFGKPVMLARDATLPLALRNKTLTLLDTSSKSRYVSLETAVDALQRATGIPFRIDPDVYTPKELLLPKSFGTTAGTAQAAATTQPTTTGVSPSSLPPLPVALGLGGGSGGVNLSTASERALRPENMMVELPSDKPLPAGEIADLFANRLGISWEYDDTKRIARFFRFVTKTYKMNLGAGKRTFTNAFKSSTQQLNSGTAGASSNSDPDAQVRMESQDAELPLKKIVDQLNPVMTKAGSVAYNDDTGTITLTDTKEAVEKADEIISYQKSILGKMILLNFQSVQVTVNDNGQKGYDWNLIVQGALRNVPGLSLGNSPTTLVDNTAGSAGFTVLDGAFKGTSAVVRALNEIGNASTSISLPLQLRNRRPATYDTRQLFYFLSGSSAAVGAVGGSGGVPGYTLSSGQVGFKLYAYPDADDNNDVNLSIGFDDSILKANPTITTGNGLNQQTFQEPDIRGNGVTGQEVTIHNGQTMLITGFDQTDNQFASRSMGARIPMIFGGSLTAQRTRTFTLVFVTVSIQGSGS